MATFQPCFLDAPEWCEILKDQNMIVGLPQTAPLTVSNKILAQVSSLLLEVKRLDVLDDREIKDAITQLWRMRREILDALDEIMAMAETNEEEFAPLICCKDSIYLILIDTTLLRILDSPQAQATQLSDTIQNLQDLSLSSRAFSDVELFRTALDSHIYRHFSIFLSNLALASKVTPFNMRKMAFMCRIMCSERRKRDATPHPIWARFEKAISGVNEPDWLSRIIAS